MDLLHLFRHSSDSISFAPGQILYWEGEPADFMYVVLEGQVDLIVGRMRVQSAGPGSLVGEMALIDERPRSASAVARTPCRLVPIDMQRFRSLVQENPHFATHVLTVMTDRLRTADHRLTASGEARDVRELALPVPRHSPGAAAPAMY
jgi:CRP-like cAMP-binding protein